MHINLLVIAILALLSATVPATGQHTPPKPSHLVLSYTGPFARDSDLARLQRIFGPQNVRHERLYVGEGQYKRGTVIYPTDPRRRIEIFWLNHHASQPPELIRVTNSQSLWRGPGDLKPGSTLAELELANGGLFELAGFEWDYGGTLMNWRGQLDSVGGDSRCVFGAVVTTNRNPPQAVYDKVLGDGTFSSSDAKMRALRPFVAKMGLVIKH